MNTFKNNQRILFILGLAAALVAVFLPRLTYSAEINRHLIDADTPERFWSDNRVFPDDGDEFAPPRQNHQQKHSEPHPQLQRAVDNEDKDKNNVRNNRKVCETDECKSVAKEFLTSLNKTIDPCEDFYEFACGGWSSKDVIPPSSAVWSRYMIFQDVVHRRIKGVLEEAVETSDILPVRQAKKWYQSCMDIENLERRGVTPMESIAMQAGGWPITMDEEEWDSQEYTWQNIERHYAHLTGSYAFYSISVVKPNKDAKFGSLVMKPAKKTLSDVTPLKTRNYSGKDYDAYVKLVENVAKSFVKHNGANVSKEKINKEAKEIVDFEKELFELESRAGFQQGGKSYQNFTEWYDELMDYNTNPKAKIDITSMIKESFDTVNIEIDPNTRVSLSPIKYAKGLVKLLEKTPARTIANYVHWTFVGSVMTHTTEDMRDELSAFIWQEFGVKERRPRWSECVTDMKMAHAAAYVFVNKHFTETTKNAALEMIKNIQNEMQRKIEKSNWLNDESKMIVEEKLNNMAVFLGFPNWYKNETAVINHYKGITIGGEYFDNMLSAMRYTGKMDLKEYLGTEKPEESWYIDPITVNALYVPDENTINLPAADFQAPLFTTQLPSAVNYAVAGTIVGHEMGHAFDSRGIHHGRDGNRTKLSRMVLMSYYQRAECFMHQYEEYYRRAIDPLDSEETAVTRNPKGLRPERLAAISMDENIADTNGIQSVFQAYTKLDEDAKSMTLPGLEEYNDEQLFFLSFAAMWCQIGTPQYEEKEKTILNPHSPAKMRVIGAISNTNDFSRVFNCPKGSPMNPFNKCHIWDNADENCRVKDSAIERENVPWQTQWKT